MKRLLAILAFMAGGFAAEATHPLHCSLLQSSRITLKRKEE